MHKRQQSFFSSNGAEIVVQRLFSREGGEGGEGGEREERKERGRVRRCVRDLL
jgi:hypothetical protein